MHNILFVGDRRDILKAGRFYSAETGKPSAGADVSIDRKRRTVRVYRQSVILSKKEMALLCLLLEEPNRTIPKARLSEALWPGENANENRLQSLMRNLRLKVEFAQNHIGRIVSDYGVGYRLITKQPPPT